MIPVKRLRNGFSLPVFGLGTWKMGDAADIGAIRMAIERGITHIDTIDTAENYAEGAAEQLVGQAIKGYNRSRLFIVTKVAPAHLRYESVLIAAKNSLKRLRTEYIDLYLIHAPNPDIPIKETMQAMDKLMKEGMIRNIGVSNFSVERMQAAQACTEHKIVANQLHLNLKYREPERRGILDYCQKYDVLLIAWRPVQKGVLLVGKNPLFDSICAKYRKTRAQVAINWLISQQNVVTLSKMSDSKHLQENLGALGWQLSREDIKMLTNSFPDQADISDTVPLI